MKIWLKWVGGAAVAAFLGLQFTNPPLTNPPVAPGHDLMATNPPPPRIAALLKQDCYDCHSDQTHWLWYSHVAPISWMIAQHVNEGRDAINFSEWPHDHPSWVRKRWRHIADRVESGDMPLASYTWIHREAKLSAAQRAELVQWAQKAGSNDD